MITYCILIILTAPFLSPVAFVFVGVAAGLVLERNR
jgi:hypothetical protein